MHVHIKFYNVQDISNLINTTSSTYTHPLNSQTVQKRCPRVQELCESRGGRPGLSVLISLTVSVDVKQHWTMLGHWSQFVPNMSSDIRGREVLHHHHRSDTTDFQPYTGWYFVLTIIQLQSSCLVLRVRNLVQHVTSHKRLSPACMHSPWNAHISPPAES